MNLDSRSSIRVSSFKRINAPDRELIMTELVNNLFLEEYRLVEKMHSCYRPCGGYCDRGSVGDRWSCSRL